MKSWWLFVLFIIWIDLVREIVQRLVVEVVVGVVVVVVVGVVVVGVVVIIITKSKQWDYILIINNNKQPNNQTLSNIKLIAKQVTSFSVNIY